MLCARVVAHGCWRLDVQLVVEAHVDVCALSASGASALQQAVKHKDVECLRAMLLDNPAVGEGEERRRVLNEGHTEAHGVTPLYT